MTENRIAPPTAGPLLRARAQASVLVVDGNATSRRFVELALERGAGFTVESAQDAAGAIEVLKVQVVDLIVSDTDLADMSGLRLFERLRGERRLRDAPFVILSADANIKTKVAALRAGVDDYLVKPCDVHELVARVEALVSRRRARDAARPRDVNLRGDLSVIAFPDLVGVIEMARHGGLLSISNENASGQVQFESGRVVHAEWGNLSGVEAFYKMFRERSGTFEFVAGPRFEQPRTIDSSIVELMFEAARVWDTEAESSRRELGGGKPPSLRPSVLYAAAGSSGARQGERESRPPSYAAIDPALLEAGLSAGPPLEPALDPDSTLAGIFELALRDPFALGELSAWSEYKLADWTRQHAGRERFHVHLVADLSAGVSAVLALAGAPSEGWVLECLAPARKALGLVFHLRNERTVDVVLLDVNDATAFLPALRRAPSLTIVCAPEGNMLLLGTRARSALDRLVEASHPAAVVGVGDAAFGSQLAKLRALQRRPRAYRHAEASLGEGEQDLRSLLIKGVRLWASTGGRGDGPART